MQIQHSESPDYLSYLLRLWHASGNGDHVWRISLEEPVTQETHNFKDLQCLFAFLEAQTGQGTEGDGPGRETQPASVQ